MNELNETWVKTFTDINNHVNSCNITMAHLAYKLINQNEMEFRKLCEYLEISRSKMSKLVTVGRIVEEITDIALPKSFSAIYELKSVVENIDDFNEYLKDNHMYLSNMSRREVIDWVYQYNNDDDEEDDPNGTQDVEVADDFILEVSNSFIEDVVDAKIKERFDKDHIYEDIVSIGVFLGDLSVTDDKQQELNEALLAVNRIKELVVCKED